MLTTIASVSSEFSREIVDTGRLAAFLFLVALLATVVPAMVALRIDPMLTLRQE